MPSFELHVPTPTEIRTRRDKPRPTLVEADIYDVVKRMKEIDRNLVCRLDEGHEKPWIIYEITPEGEKLVKRYEELTPAILTDLRRMASIPFMERYEILAKEIDSENAKRERLGMGEEAFERFAFNFRRALIDNGMTHSPYVASYGYRPKNHRKRATA